MKFEKKTLVEGYLFYNANLYIKTQAWLHTPSPSQIEDNSTLKSQSAA